jgi:AhpD family alkylhydroperoxidase
MTETTAEFMPLVEPDDLPADIRAQWDATEREGLRDFTRLMAHAPEQFRLFNAAYASARFDNRLGVRVTELVRIAVAQTTRCPVCIAGRHAGAVAEGMTEELVAEIGGERRCMTDEERVAVDFAQKFATDHLSITDADEAELRRFFDPEQVVQLVLLSVFCLVGRFSMLAGLQEQSCPI